MPWRRPDVAAPLAVAWDYLRLVHPVRPADAILTLGSFDVQAAVHAAALWKQGLAPVVVMSGGIAHRGGVLDTGWDRPEAQVFAEAAIGAGVPAEAILLEERAQNTGDNFTFGREVMARTGLVPRRLIVVAKPYMTRRGYATGRKVWPEIELAMQCEAIDAGDYFARQPDPERTLLALVGDLHRIFVYPSLGFQIEQPVAAEVVEALRQLVAAGFGARLVPGYDAAGVPIPGSLPRRP
jgi:uncharacterized SAM-binding protein YcdF (DUF218 family)